MLQANCPVVVVGWMFEVVVALARLDEVEFTFVMLDESGMETDTFNAIVPLIFGDVVKLDEGYVVLLIGRRVILEERYVVLLINGRYVVLATVGGEVIGALVKLAVVLRAVGG